MSPRQLARKIVWATGLQGAVFRFREWKMAASAPPALLSDRRPMPPALLRVQVCGNADPDYFLTSGRATMAELAAALERAGTPLGAAGAVLDLGCGCGRLARWVEAPDRLTGMDINARSVGWCAQHLPGDWIVNAIGESLPAADAAFDIVYACSVITHLREATARAWLAEIARVLRPGGAALVTFQDAGHPQAAAVKPQLEAQGFALRFDSLEGSNLLASFVTAERLAQLAAPGLVSVLDISSRDTSCGEAIAVLRKAP